MHYTTLIDADSLARQLDAPGWVVLDCRYSLADAEAGRRAYEAGHIPGARYAHMDDDLAGPTGADTGRHPLPDPDTLAQRLGAWGMDRDTQVVAYDDAGGAMAARLWWLLRWLGHRRVAVLDGGFPAWEAAGHPITTAPPRPERVQYVAVPDAVAWVDTGTVARQLAQDAVRLLDARAPARFRGEAEPIDPVAGHIPGADNLPFQDNLDPDGHFLPVHRLRARFAAALGDAPPASVVHMCGSGVTACHNLLAMEHAGLPGSRLYPGSWSEWIRDPERPVATGEAGYGLNRRGS